MDIVRDTRGGSGYERVNIVRDTGWRGGARGYFEANMVERRREWMF